MKRFSLIFAAVLLASAVVSCGGGETTTTPETTAAVTGGESTVETEEVATAEAVMEAVEVEEKIEEEGFLSDNVKALSPTRLVLKRFFRSKLSIIGLVLIGFAFMEKFITELEEERISELTAYL